MRTALLRALAVIVLAFSSLVTGCEESELGPQKQLRLMGDENLKMSRQLRLLNRRIQRQKNLLAKEDYFVTRL